MMFLQRQNHDKTDDFTTEVVLTELLPIYRGTDVLAHQVLLLQQLIPALSRCLLRRWLWSRMSISLATIMMFFV